MPAVLPKFVAVYAFLYAAFGVLSPFLPALLREHGLHAEEIGARSRRFHGPSAFWPVPRLVMPLIVCTDTHRSCADVRSRQP